MHSRIGHAKNLTTSFISIALKDKAILNALRRACNIRQAAGRLLLEGSSILYISISPRLVYGSPLWLSSEVAVLSAEHGLDPQS